MRRLSAILIWLAAGLLASGDAQATSPTVTCTGSPTAECYLVAKEVSAGDRWGYAEWDGIESCGSTTGTASVPGPRVVVPDAATGVTLHLCNELPVPTSLIVPGLPLPPGSGPVMAGGRVQSFVHEAAAGTGTADYTWASFPPGSRAYQSGTDPSLSQPRGLYGAITKDAAPGEVYPGMAYDHEVLLFYHEFDASLASGGVGTPLPNTASYSNPPLTGFAHANPSSYDPDALMVETYGTCTASAPIDCAVPAGMTLVRLFNLGLRDHAPQLVGAPGYVLAEDGLPYADVRERNAVLLVAGKTKDVLVPYGPGTSLSVLDAMARLDSAQSSSDETVVSFGALPADVVTITKAKYRSGPLEFVVHATTDHLPAGSAVLTMTYPGLGSPLTMNWNAAKSRYQKTVFGVGASPASVTVTSDFGGVDSATGPF